MKIIIFTLSLLKITYVKEKGKVLYKTKYNDYFGENVKLFKATDFIADLTIHIPPRTHGRAEQQSGTTRPCLKKNKSPPFHKKNPDSKKEIADEIILLYLDK